MVRHVRGSAVHDDTTWDYIVVGAGSAGCVLADRLTESGEHSVLVLEAGGSDLSVNVQLAIGLFRLPPRMDWDYQGEPDPSLGGRVDRWAAGKVVGGGSSVNGMMWVRGNPADYDEWAKLGAHGWGYSDVLPYFRRAESFEGGVDDFRGDAGPQAVSFTHVRHPMNDAFLTGAAQTGFSFNRDYNGASQVGASLAQVSQRRGLRWSTARGYLAPARRRSNCTLWTGVQAHRILFEGSRAVGLEISRAGEISTVHCHREVIVSAGAIGTPKLLMLSGVGPADDLRRVGIAPVADIPGVGQNLSEHACVPLAYDVNVQTLNQEFGPKGFVKHGLDFVLRGRGGVTATPAQAMVFGSFDPGDTRTDFEIMFGPFGTAVAPPKKSRDDAYELRAVTLAKNSTVRALVCPVHPHGRGSLSLRSSDPGAGPRIERPMYGDPRDVEQMLRAIRITRTVFESPALRKYVVAETLPGADRTTDDEIMEMVRQISYGGQHASGTCRMGTDAGAVVDPALKVAGVEGLRVVDASVMPTLTSGNSNAPVIMIAERAADLILTS